MSGKIIGRDVSQRMTGREKHYESAIMTGLRRHRSECSIDVLGQLIGNSFRI